MFLSLQSLTPATTPELPRPAPSAAVARASIPEFSALFAEWIAFLDASPATVSTYTHNLRHFFAFLSQNRIASPTRETVIAYREHLKETKKAATVFAYLAPVKLFFRWTASKGYFSNISEHMKAVKVDNREHKKDFLNFSQSKRLLASIDTTEPVGKRDYALLFLMLTTGIRTISAIRANVGDIRAVGGESALFYQGKGRDDKTAYVKLSSEVEAAIRDYLATRGNVAGTEPLFVATSNRNLRGRMTTRTISRIAKMHLVAAGYVSDRLTAHSLRHTAATLALLSGASLEATKELLDHKSINTTLIYSHALDRAKDHTEQNITAGILSA